MKYDPIDVNSRDFFFDAFNAIRRRGGRPVENLAAYVGLGDITFGWEEDVVKRRKRLSI